MKRMDGSTKNVKVMSKLGEKNKSFQGVKFWLVSIVMFLLANSLKSWVVLTQFWVREFLIYNPTLGKIWTNPAIGLHF